MRFEEQITIQDAKTITCPFCFGKFHPYEVIFRSNYKYVQETSDATAPDAIFGDLRNSGKHGTQNSDSEDDRSLFTPFEGPYDDRARKRDQKLEMFWENRGGASGFQRQDPRWNYPHIDPRSSDFSRMIIRSEQTDERGFVRDKDGWISRVLEKYGDNNLEMSRLCPHCHNPLPFKDYGKYETLFISVVGIRASGKTVYINQLLSNFSHYISHTGFVMGPVLLAEGIQNEEVARGKQLPASTDDAVMRRPSAMTMRKTQNDEESITIVFYDIAGENCINDARSGKMSTVSRFLAFSDGLLFLIDPEQVPIYAQKGGVSEKDIQTVIDKVNNLRAEHNMERSNWTDVPVAIVLTKSDTIPEGTGAPSVIYRNNSYLSPTGEKLVGFNRFEFDEISDSLGEEFLNKTRSIEDSLMGFPKRGYFAVSAITCGVANKFVKYGNLYTLDDATYDRFRDIKKWLDGWEARDEEARRHFPQPPMRDNNGKPIVFAPEQTIEAYGDILTDLSATADEFSGESINLSIAEIHKDINLLGYPVADPAPRRIEEPFLWILWQLRKIPPYFRYITPPPTKKFWEGEKRYQEKMSAYEAARRHAESDYYAGKDLDHGKPKGQVDRQG